MIWPWGCDEDDIMLDQLMLDDMDAPCGSDGLGGDGDDE